ncbi:hypothetical protein K470DRAFT_259921 [Piedraia hortae CBS 480.64]|uniref:C4-dicarboxylate transporter/malic acid transport protein n=1 Tax=Piedraia hortae CBS 480.64 TaxID=1314780 RepID=A0A6A7BSY7_9PEZI|nr:hypothetical protein K470DRAFT_259921 [Piedraia hortae CBS 480.64]
MLAQSEISSKTEEEQPKSSKPSINEEPVAHTRPQVSIDNRNERGWRRIVRNFSPSWFTVNMGTGIVSIIFYMIPWKAKWITVFSIMFFGLNIVLFTLALVISILRYTIWPEIWSVMIADPNNSLFLGTAPMGFATIAEMWILLCSPAWGNWAVKFGWALWMIDSIVAVIVTLVLGILLMSASHERGLHNFTAAQILPIAATTVAAGVGSEVAWTLPNAQYALGTLVVSFTMWSMAMPMIFCVLMTYFHRLAMHRMPPRETVASVFLPVGPLAFGGFGALQMGKLAMKLFPKTKTLDPMTGQIFYSLGFLTAFVLWGWGLVWFIYGLASIYISWPIPFNMGWWGFTFPIGLYAITTILIGEELPSLFFRVAGTIIGASVLLLWMVIAAGTIKGIWTGKLFHSPYLANLQTKREYTTSEKSHV